MKYFIVVILLALSNAGFAQKMYEEKLSSCPLKFVLEDTEYLINYLPDDSVMVIDFLGDMEQKHIDKLKGVIMMQVMIDTAYNACLVSYTNKTTLSNKRLNLSERIQTMKGWRRTSDLGEYVNACALIVMIFDKKEFHVQRTAYNRNKGKRLMSSTVYKRYLEPVVADSIPKIQVN